MLPTEIIVALSETAYAAEVLTAVAATTGNARFRHAAGILRGMSGGRPSRDDRYALDRMASLLKVGLATSAEQAARFVGELSTEAAAARLSRKFADKTRNRRAFAIPDAQIPM